MCTTQTGLNLEEGLAPHGMVILPDNLLDHLRYQSPETRAFDGNFCIKRSHAVSSGRSRFGSSQHHHIQHGQSERRASDDLGSPQVDDTPWPPKLHSHVTVAGTKAVFLWKLRGSLHPAVAAQFGARGSSRLQRPLHSSSHQARLRFVFGCRFVLRCGTGARWAAGTPGPRACGAGGRKAGRRTCAPAHRAQPSMYCRAWPGTATCRGGPRGREVHQLAPPRAPLPSRRGRSGGLGFRLTALPGGTVPPGRAARTHGGRVRRTRADRREVRDEGRGVSD